MDFKEDIFGTSQWRHISILTCFTASARRLLTVQLLPPFVRSPRVGTRYALLISIVNTHTGFPSGFRVAEFLTSPEESHLSLTEELTLGRDMLPSNEEKSERHRPEQHRIRFCSDILGKCLGEISNLTSLTCVFLYYSSSSPTSLPA